MPALTTRSIASLKASDLPPPILKFMTACVIGFGFAGERIQSREAIIPDVLPRPLQPITRIGTTIAFLAIPYCEPAAVVATCVP